MTSKVEKKKYGRDELEFYIRDVDDWCNSDYCRSYGKMRGDLLDSLSEFLEVRRNVDFVDERQKTYNILKGYWLEDGNKEKGFDKYFDAYLDEEREESKVFLWNDIWKNHLPEGFNWEDDKSWMTLPLEAGRNAFFEFHDTFFGN